MEKIHAMTPKPRWRLLLVAPNRATIRPDLPTEPVKVIVAYSEDRNQAVAYTGSPRGVCEYFYERVE